MDSYWQTIARRWQLIGPPLRPGEGDLKIVRDVIAAWPADRRLRGLVLGATQEFHALPWREGAPLAIDRTHAMLGALWPGMAACGDWCSLPLADASIDLTLCDGGLNVIPAAGGRAAFVESLRRVTAKGGEILIRLYLPFDGPTSAGEAIADAVQGRIDNINVLKLRLWGTLRDPASGVVNVADVWRAYEACGESTQLPAAWREALGAYRNCPDQYWFGPVDEVNALFCDKPGGFSCVGTFVPDEPTGESCPTIRLRRE